MTAFADFPVFRFDGAAKAVGLVIGLALSGGLIWLYHFGYRQGEQQARDASGHIQAESIEITGPGGQIVIHCHDKPTIRVIDAQKVGGIDRSSENILAECKEQRGGLGDR